MASRRDKPDQKKGPPSTAMRIVNRQVPAVPDSPSERLVETDDAEVRKRRMLTAHQLNLVWLQLRGKWTWIAVIPAEPDLSIADFAHALREVGSRLSSESVDFIEATNVDLDSASWLIGRLGTSAGSGDTWGRNAGSDAPNWMPPAVRTLVALDNPVANPLALPVALAADGLVVCVRRGRTPLSAIRRTLEAVGTDRIVCTVLID